MTQEELEKIREREQAATPGPWTVDIWSSQPNTVQGISPIGICTDYGDYGPENADAEFIAHAREDIPDLLQHIEEQNSYIEGLEKIAVRLGIGLERLEEGID